MVCKTRYHDKTCTGSGSLFHGIMSLLKWNSRGRSILQKMTQVDSGLSQPDNLDHPEIMRSTIVNLLLQAALLVPHALCFPNLLLPNSTTSRWGRAGPGDALIPPGKGGTWGYITVREGAHMFWSGLLLQALHGCIVHAGNLMRDPAGGLSPAESVTMRLWTRSH